MFLDPEVFIGTMIERFVHHAINVSVYIKYWWVALRCFQ